MAHHSKLDLSFLDEDDLDGPKPKEADAATTPMDTSKSKAPPTVRT